MNALEKAPTTMPEPNTEQANETADAVLYLTRSYGEKQGTELIAAMLATPASEIVTLWENVEPHDFPNVQVERVADLLHAQALDAVESDRGQHPPSPFRLNYDLLQAGLFEDGTYQRLVLDAVTAPYPPRPGDLKELLSIARSARLRRFFMSWLVPLTKPLQAL